MTKGKRINPEEVPPRGRCSRLGSSRQTLRRALASSGVRVRCLDAARTPRSSPRRVAGYPVRLSPGVCRRNDAEYVQSRACGRASVRARSRRDYSSSHVLDDVAAALQWLRTPAVADSYRVNRRRLILVGHSFGGFAALYGAAADAGVREVAALAPIDLGRRSSERSRDAEALAAVVRQLDGQLGPLRGTSGQALVQEGVTHATDWLLQGRAHILAGKRVLLVAATRDAVAPLGEVYEPLGAALRRERAQHLTAETLDSDHAFSNSRVRLARLLLRWLCSEQ